jgi:polyketide synthase 7
VLPALAAWRRRRQAQSVVDRWRYRVIWQPVTGAADAALGGRWLLVVPAALTGGELATACEQVLVEGGAQVVTVAAGTAELDRDILAARLHQAVAEDGAAGLVSLLALGEGDCDGTPAGVAGTLVLVQALGDAGIEARLWALTRGAIAAGDEQAPSAAQAMVWGLGRTVAIEHPRRWGGLIDIPAVSLGRDLAAGLTGRTAGWLRAMLAGNTGEDQVAIREAGVLARRLVRAASADPAARSWRPSGPVLVTGGTGALGGQVARWLASRGASRVILVSRRGIASAGMGALAARLCAQGSELTIAVCDVADRADLAALWGRLARTGITVRAVMHAAGVLDDGVVDALTPARLATVLAPKAAAAAHLDELTMGLDLDAFVLFSSIAGALGSAGQGNYAAANACLDAIAEHRRSRGLPATSVAWGVWGGGGMAGQATAATRAHRGGLAAMSPQLAAAALGLVLAQGQATAVVADVDWGRFAPAYTSARPSPLLAGIAEARQAMEAAAGSAETGHGGLAARLAGLAAAGQERAVLEAVCQVAAAVLGYESAGAVRPGAAFRDLGFDSLTAVEFRNQMAIVAGVQLPATMAFDYPTPQELARWLRTIISPATNEDADPNAEEAEIRRALATIPLARLRSVGLIAPLLRLADFQSEELSLNEESENDSIDAMDAESLIRMARGNAEM